MRVAPASHQFAMTPTRTHFTFWLMVAGFWAGTCAVLVAQALNGGGADALLADTDDAMRLLVVRDLMSGQAWFDIVQHRLNTPFGAEVHWSRLVDLPLSLLIRGFGLVAPDHAETLALFAWPLLLAFILFALVGKLATTLAGRDGVLPALALTAFALPVLSEFAPGRIDHHNVQAILTLWLCLTSVRAIRSPKSAAWAGVAAATSMAIGAETLPVVAIAVLAFGLFWIADATHGRQMRMFGFSMAGALLVHFLIAVGPDRYLAVQCDAISIVYLVAVGAGGLLLGVLATASHLLPSPVHRLVAGAGAGGALVALVVLAFPECLEGPFADLEPWLRSAWVSNVLESRTLAESFAALPAYTVALSVPPVLGVVVCIVAILVKRGPTRLAWLTYAALLLASVMAFALQIRGVRLSAALAAPAGAWAIISARGLLLRTPRSLRVLPAVLLCLSWLCFSGIAVLVAGNLAFGPRGSAPDDAHLGACTAPARFSGLDALAPQRIAAPIDLGPYILIHTPHEVIGGPYHRNGAGIGDTFRIFGAEPETARRILAERGITLVVVCDEMLGSAGGGLNGANNLGAALAEGTPPDWLDPIPMPDGALEVYAVLP